MCRVTHVCLFDRRPVTPIRLYIYQRFHRFATGAMTTYTDSWLNEVWLAWSVLQLPLILRELLLNLSRVLYLSCSLS